MVNRGSRAKRQRRSHLPEPGTYALHSVACSPFCHKSGRPTYSGATDRHRTYRELVREPLWGHGAQTAKMRAGMCWRRLPAAFALTSPSSICTTDRSLCRSRILRGWPEEQEVRNQMLFPLYSTKSVFHKCLGGLRSSSLGTLGTTKVAP